MSDAIPSAMADTDILIIGGGINGCGIARDAAGRGYSVMLAEMNDLASGTSCGSTKLIHGGLRYLEYYDFALVRKALKEREVLWRSAPHIIRPLRFVLPARDPRRPVWLIRLGLFLYDHIGGRKLLAKTRTLDLRSDPAGLPLKPGKQRAFEYSDCWVDDARLVVLAARDAAAKGARILTQTRVTHAERNGQQWRVTLADNATGETSHVRARLLINAAGPWVDDVLAKVLGKSDSPKVRLVQGAHIVVRKLFDGERPYIFPGADGRIVFAIPYEQDFTLIGTTDQGFTGDPANAAITPGEITYLCNAISAYFKEPVVEADIVWTFAAVRPLFEDGAAKAQEVTRDYVLQREAGAETGAAPVINVIGGKITTFRLLAEDVMAMAEKDIGGKNPRWTAAATLPGGDFPVDGAAALTAELRAAAPCLTPAHALRLMRAYGTDARRIIAGITKIGDLGRCFGADLYERELLYLMDNEWARNADDVLWRRSKLGLRLRASEAMALDDWMATTCSMRAGKPAAPAPESAPTQATA